MGDTEATLLAALHRDNGDSRQILADLSSYLQQLVKCDAKKKGYVL